MRTFKLIPLLAIAALLSACGDSDKFRFNQVVTFGDSLSDAGAYRVGSIAQLGAGD